MDGKGERMAKGKGEWSRRVWEEVGEGEAERHGAWARGRGRGCGTQRRRTDGRGEEAGEGEGEEGSRVGDGQEAGGWERC